jgi:hypothetical protein
MYRQKELYTDRWADKQTRSGHIDRQMDRQVKRKNDEQTDVLKMEEGDKRTNTKMDNLTDG